MIHELHITTKVLPGSRIEVSAPGLPEGMPVEITLHFEMQSPSEPQPIVDFFNSLPAGPHSAATWEEFEARFQAERNAWKA